MSKRGSETLKNADITGTVYRLKLAGTYLLTDDFYIGFIHPSERYQEPRLGEVVSGRVIGVRPDGVLNLSLKPRAYEAISNDAAMIMTFLDRAADHRIPLLINRHQKRFCRHSVSVKANSSGRSVP